MDLIKSASDRDRALDILEKAFLASPGMTWMIKPGRSDRFRMLLRHCYEEAKAYRGHYLTKDRSGVVFFYNLKNKRGSLRLFFRQLTTTLFVTGVRRGIQASEVRRMVDKIRPKSGWCAWLLASDEKPGNGATNEIRREIFELADQTSEPIYVETTRKRMRLVYERIGFKEYHKVKHPYEETYIWFLKRDPFTGYKSKRS